MRKDDRKLNAQELNKILELHKKWLSGDEDGERADLHDADLRWANLSNADLRWANLSNADLRWANLSNADLRWANLSNANLRHANLCNANLRHADLCNADLYDAILYHANLSHADLSDAIIAWGLACPETGSFEAWKKVVDENGTEFLVKLLVPADAKRSSATTEKCRCEFADVLEITNIKTNQAVQSVEKQSVENMSYFPTITYRVGERVYPDSFDENRWNECSHGIHFFVDKESAIYY